MSDDDQVIAKIKKSALSEVWVTLKTYAGRRSCDIREYFHPADSPGWLPTRKGVSVPLEDLAQAVDAAEELSGQEEVGVVAEIPRSRKAKLLFAIREFQKHVYGEVRTYYRDDEEKDWKPGKGVTLPLGMLGQLADALRLAEDQI